MKRLFGTGLLMACILATALSLAACGGAGGTGSADETESPIETESREETAETRETVETAGTAETVETERTFDPNGPRYRITVREGDEDLVSEVPESAVAGETVTIMTVCVTDADVYVSVNGDNEYGNYRYDGYFEFVMPEEDVEIAVAIISNGLA